MSGDHEVSSDQNPVWSFYKRSYTTQFFFEVYNKLLYASFLASQLLECHKG